MANGNIGQAFRTVDVAKRWLVSCGIDRSRVSCSMRHTTGRISSPLLLVMDDFRVRDLCTWTLVPHTADCVPSGWKYNLWYVLEGRREREKGRALISFDNEPQFETLSLLNIVSRRCCKRIVLYFLPPLSLLFIFLFFGGSIACKGYMLSSNFGRHLIYDNVIFGAKEPALISRW